MSQTQPPEESFDRILERLRQVVERLEGGGMTLEESLAAFEDGVRLSRRGTQILDAAERRVEVLLRAEGPGGPEVARLDGEPS
jgi:exodeoxyribonuclease VII small subunit